MRENHARASECECCVRIYISTAANECVRVRRCEPAPQTGDGCARARARTNGCDRERARSPVGHSLHNMAPNGRRNRASHSGVGWRVCVCVRLCRVYMFTSIFTAMHYDYYRPHELCATMIKIGQLMRPRRFEAGGQHIRCNACARCLHSRTNITSTLSTAVHYPTKPTRIRFYAEHPSNDHVGCRFNGA